MSWLRLTWRNIGRNRIRTLLTILSVFFSVLLLCILDATLSMWSGPPTKNESRIRLVVRNKTSLANPLPEAYRQKIEQIPGVRLVHAMDWFGGEIKDSHRFFPQFASDAKTTFEMFDEDQVDDAAKQAFLSQRTAAIAGRKLAAQMGWKVGDRVTLLGRIYPVNPELTLVGLYGGPDESLLWFRRDYLEESLGNPGQVGTYWVRLERPEDVARVVDAVDSMFENSFAPTKTETEQAFSLSFLEMLGNIRLLISLFGGAACFTILMVAGNTMAMVVRERTTEIAVLKTLGFSQGRVMGMVLLESVFIATIGAAAAVAASVVMAWGIRSFSQSGWFTNFYVYPHTAAMGLGAGLAVGAVAGLWPAWRGATLRIADGLRRVD